LGGGRKVRKKAIGEEDGLLKKFPGDREVLVSDLFVGWRKEGKKPGVLY